MSRLAATFRGLARNGRKALITFVTAGDPDLATTGRLIPLLAKAGADVIELGVPFSDPMADGPTIQLSSERALAAGTTLGAILDTVREARRTTHVPIILMGYFNPIFRYGAERFAADAAAAGVDGVLLVDLPPEEGGEFRAQARRHGLDLIYLLSPTSDAGRIDRVAREGSGFIYYVSVTGVTGARGELPADLFAAVRQVRERVRLPVAVGFGIADPEQAGRVAEVADGVVVGSAIVRLFERYGGEELLSRVPEFVATLRAGIDRAGTAQGRQTG